VHLLFYSQGICYDARSYEPKSIKKLSCLNLCFQKFGNAHVNIVIFVIVIYVTAKPTVIMVVFLRSLKECVHYVHINYILHLVNHFDSEDGAYNFLQNFVKTFDCDIVPKSSKEFPCEK
jgi:hypothetical protein